MSEEKRDSLSAFTTLETRLAGHAQLGLELRNALNTIVGYSEMLGQDAQDSGREAFKPDFKKLHKTGLRLLTIVNSAFDASKLETGRLDSTGLPNLQAKLEPEMRGPLDDLLTVCAQSIEQSAGLKETSYEKDLRKILDAAQKIKGLMTPGGIDPALAAGFRRLAPVIRRLQTQKAAPKAEPGLLLLVDDNESTLDILSRQLYRDGHTFYAAPTGARALQLMEQRRFDIVMLGVTMPDMDGFQILERLKTNPAWAETPVMMISGLDDLASVSRCLEMGAEDYLTKPFDPTLLRVRVGSCLEKKRLRDELRARLESIQNELDIAARIQREILPLEFPPFPQVKEIDLFAQMIPARAVGGDFYDFFLLDEDRVGLVIGDVSGKGVPASLFMAVTRTMVKAIALSGRDAGGCLEQVNHMLVQENRSMMFVTIFYAILNFHTGKLEYSSAGHNPPYILRKTGEVEIINAIGGVALGIVDDQPYVTESTELTPGDRLFLFTDGVTEAFNAKQDMFSEERLVESLGRAGAITPEELLRLVVEDVRAFTAGAPQSDDLTMLTITWEGRQ